MKSLIKKEIASLLYNPGFYLIYLLFIFSWFYVFLKDVFIVGYSSLTSLFDIFPWILLFMVGALSMGSIAREKEQGTLELLFSKPISALTIIASKIISLSLILATTLIFVIPIALTFNKFGQIDFGVFYLQIVASVFLIITMVSLGVAISSFFGLQIASLFVFIFCGSVFYISGISKLTVRFPTYFAKLLERYSVLSHYASLSRGVFDLSDVFYFIIVISFIIAVASLQLQKGTKSYTFGLTLLQFISSLAAVLLIYYFTSINLYRADFTHAQTFTLSKVTKQSLALLKSPLKVTLYVSSNIPIQYSPVLKEVKYILQDLVANGHNKVTLDIVDPSLSPEMAKDAENMGVNLTQFNVYGKEKLEVVKGYFGLTLSYQDKKEVIPFISSIDGFEFILTSIIRRTLDLPKKTIKFVYGDGERDIDTDYLQFNSVLTGAYNVTSQSSSELVDDADVLVFAAPTTKLSDKTVQLIKTHLDEGKSIVFLLERFEVNETLKAVATENSSADLMEQYGIYVKKDLIFDTTANEQLTLSDGETSYTVQYPFWIRSIYDTQSDLFTNSGIKYVSIPWASSITFDPQKLKDLGFTAKPLLVTTNSAGVDNTNYDVTPERKYSSDLNGKFTVGITLEKAGDNKGSGRSVLISDGEFLTDLYIKRAPNNLGFAADLLSWVTNDTSMAELQTKNSPLSAFYFSKENQPEEIKNTVYGYAVIIPVSVGFLIIMLRKLKTRR